MNNLHPRVLERFLAQLPEGSAITAARSDNLLRSVLTVVTDGVTNDNVQLEKTSLPSFLKRAEAGITATAGETLTDVIKRFAEKYDLFWVEGVDYKVDEQVVEFGDLTHFVYDLTVPEDSVIWTGNIVLWVHKEQPTETKNQTIQVPLQGPRLQIALSGHVFQGEGEVFTSGKKALTAKFSKKVIAYLETVGITDLTAADLGKGQIIDVVTDGFSGMVVLKPKKGPHLFIRYRSKGEDIIMPSPGDVDPE